MENTDFDFGIHGRNNPIIIKEKVAVFMKNILNDDNIISILEVKHGRTNLCLGCSR